MVPQRTHDGISELGQSFDSLLAQHGIRQTKQHIADKAALAMFANSPDGMNHHLRFWVGQQFLELRLETIWKDNQQTSSLLAVLFSFGAGIRKHSVEYFAGGFQALAWAGTGQKSRDCRAHREVGEITQLLDVVQGVNMREVGQVQQGLSADAQMWILQQFLNPRHHGFITSLSQHLDGFLPHLGCRVVEQVTNDWMSFLLLLSVEQA